MTNQLIQSVKLSAASKKLLAEATRKRDELLALASSLEPDRGGRTSELHRLADEAVAAFWGAPSRELAEIAHDRLVRSRDSEISFAALDQGIHANLPAAARIAEGAALQVLDDAITELNRQHEAAIAAAPSGGVFTTKAQLDTQHAAALSDLQGARNAILTGDPLSWLENNGFTAA